MATRLYLDTARLGLLSKRTQAAQSDFVRLAGEEGASPFFDDFLRFGYESWPADLKARYVGLRHWSGVDELKQALCVASSAPTSTRVHLASRSAQIMKLCARTLFLRARRVLVTDLIWPGYGSILEWERRSARGEVKSCPLLEFILRGKATARQVVKQVVEFYFQNRCDGLFLPEVSQHGVHLPVEAILAAIRAKKPPKIAVVDSAQAFCQVPSEGKTFHADLYLAGTHKWLRGYYPMGVLFLPCEGSASFVESTLGSMIENGELEDPLLTFSLELEKGALGGFSETVNLTSLFSARAALAESAETPHRFSQARANAHSLAAAAADTEWRAVEPAEDLGSAILLLQASRPEARVASPDALRRQFQAHGVALTAYSEGLIRLSMPTVPWSEDETAQVLTALKASVGTCRVGLQ